MSTELLIFFLPLCKNAHNCFFFLFGVGRQGRKRSFVLYKILFLPGIPTCIEAPFMLFQHSERILTCYPIWSLLCCQKNVKRLQASGAQLSSTAQWREAKNEVLAAQNLAEPKGYQLTEWVNCDYRNLHYGKSLKSNWMNYIWSWWESMAVVMDFNLHLFSGMQCCKWRNNVCELCGTLLCFVSLYYCILREHILFFFF